jgi:hypothetical protein
MKKKKDSGADLSSQVGWMDGGLKRKKAPAERSRAGVEADKLYRSGRVPGRINR